MLGNAVALGFTPGGGTPVILTMLWNGTTQYDFLFKLPVGKQVTIYWGDGSSDVCAGAGNTTITKTSTYSGGAASYTFWIDGDVYFITNIQISGWQNRVSGNIDAWGGMTDLTYVSISSVTGITLNILSWANLTKVTYANLQSCPGLTGDMSILRNWTLLKTFYASNLDNITFLSDVAWQNPDASVLRLDGCNFDATTVDRVLKAWAGKPIANSTMWLHGDNANRTAASDADVATILGAGNTLLVNP